MRPPPLKAHFLKVWGNNKVTPPAPHFGLKITNLLVFLFNCGPEKCFQVPIPWGLARCSGTSANAFYAVFSHFCYVGFFLVVVVNLQ